MTAEFYAKKFLEALRKESRDKIDPVSEWRLLDTTGNFETNCICSKDICQVFYIQNKLTQKTLKIGSDCAERWLSCRLECMECHTALGNVMKRRREKDFLCRSCKKNKKERDSNIFLFGKYEGYPWYQVAKDQSYVNWLANLEKRTNYQEGFLKYCSLYYYDFEEKET